MPTSILFLDASNEVLLRHKENYNTRSRNFFEHHLKYLLPLKKMVYRKRKCGCFKCRQSEC